MALLEPVAVPPEVTATQFGQLAVVKFVPFQHLLLVESLIEMLTALMPEPPVPESVVVPVKLAGKPAPL